MALIPICNPSDERIAVYRDLPDRQLRFREGRFVAEGELVVRRLLASSYDVESLLVAEGQEHRLQVAAEVPVYLAPSKLIEQIAGFRFHRGILGCGVRSPRPSLRDLVPPITGGARIMVCAAVRDPENLGGILRNCAAFGVDLVILGHGSVDPFARRVIRVSMATVLQLNIYESLELEQDLKRLRDDWQIHFVATVLNCQAPPLATASRPARLGLVLGNEGTGLGDSVVEMCASRVTIPMSSRVDSLNVAVASGIFLYHFSHLRDVGG